MAKKARREAAAKAKKAKASPSRKSSAAKPQGKVAAQKRAKSAAKKRSVAEGKPAGNQFAKQRESLLQKVEGAVEAVLDTLTEAERLHHKLEPGISPDPE